MNIIVFIPMRVDITCEEGVRQVVVRMSRRNLHGLLQKLDMPGSARTLTSQNCWENGVLAPLTVEQAAVSDAPPTLLVVIAEGAVEHYASRPVPPGVLHPATETFVARHGGWSKTEG